MPSPWEVVRAILARPDATEAELRSAYHRGAHLPEGEQQRAAEALVCHPNCPPDLFARLLPHAVEAALQNPAWPLLVLESAFVVRLESGFLAHCLRRETTPPALLQALTLHPESGVATAARQHVALAGEAGAGWEDALLTDWATRLWRDSALVWLARAGGLPAAVNGRLPYPLAPEPLLPRAQRAQVLEKIADQRGLRLAPVLALAQRAYPPSAHTTHRHWERRLALALNPALHELDREALTHDGHRWVRAAAGARLTLAGLLTS